MHIFYGWWIVGLTIVGLSSSPAPFFFASLGLFMAPLEQEFGWSRSEMSVAYTVLTIATAIAMPVIGRLIDNTSLRAVLLFSLISLGVCLLLTPAIKEVWHLYVIYLFVGLFAAGSNSVPYMKAITAWFNKKRGLAIGISIGGIGLGYFYTPLIIEVMIDRFGWRSAYFSLAAIAFTLIIPLIYLFFKEKPGDLGLQQDGGLQDEQDKSGTRENFGITPKDAYRSKEFRILFLTFVCLAFVLNGVMAHFVPMVMDHGVSRSTAAVAASFIGITVFISRILIGYLIDRFCAPRVAALFFTLSAFGIVLLLPGFSNYWVFVTALLLGLSIGAEVDILAYLTGRYFGVNNFAEIYGVLFSSILVGTALGPLIFGICFEMTGSYLYILVGSTVLILFSVSLTFLLEQGPETRQSVHHENMN